MSATLEDVLALGDASKWRKQYNTRKVTEKGGDESDVRGFEVGGWKRPHKGAGA